MDGGLGRVDQRLGFGMGTRRSGKKVNWNHGGGCWWYVDGRRRWQGMEGVRKSALVGVTLEMCVVLKVDVIVRDVGVVSRHVGDGSFLKEALVKELGIGLRWWRRSWGRSYIADYVTSD
jgi:hypothetical protein